MAIFWQIIALIAVVAGTFFSVVGVLGYIRLPDVYTRLQATGKVGVFGVVLLLNAAVISLDLGLGQGILLILLLLITGPVTSHALASAAYRIGLPFKRAVRNDLEMGSADSLSATGGQAVRVPGKSGD